MEVVKEREVGRRGEEDPLIVGLDGGSARRSVEMRTWIGLDEIGSVKEECDEEGKRQGDGRGDEARGAEGDEDGVEQVGEEAAYSRPEDDAQACHSPQDPHVLRSGHVVNNVGERGSTDARGAREKARCGSQGQEGGEGGGEVRNKGGGGKEERREEERGEEDGLAGEGVREAPQERSTQCLAAGISAHHESVGQAGRGRGRREEREEEGEHRHRYRVKKCVQELRRKDQGQDLPPTHPRGVIRGVTVEAGEKCVPPDGDGGGDLGW